MSEVTYVTSRALSIEGVTYTISVYSKLGGFFAFWECGQCDNQTQPIVPADTRDAAIERCQQMIQQHHEEHAVVMS